jgi:tripartite-type tricarboxylate transporter receptor subunit TctC
MKDQLAALGYTTVGSTPEEFGALIVSEIARWAPIVVKSGATVD